MGHIASERTFFHSVSVPFFLEFVCPGEHHREARLISFVNRLACKGIEGFVLSTDKKHVAGYLKIRGLSR